MSTANNRLSQRIPLHRRSEHYRGGGVTFLRGRQLRALKQRPKAAPVFQVQVVGNP